MMISFPNLNGAKRKELIILTLCLFIGFALRFYCFDKKSLWVDEIHSFNDSRFSLKDRIKFYKEDPTHLHPPLFFVLTHFFHPFTKPERDLRIIPLIFGTLSIPMIYFLSRLFCPGIALPCTFSLTFMTYHIYLSQDGRSYSMVMFLGMGALYFFLKHLRTLKKGYLFPSALFFSMLFHTSYTSVAFIVLSQMLWFYRLTDDSPRPSFSSFSILSGLCIGFSIPWLLFVASNYGGQPIMDPYHTEDLGSFWKIMYWVFHDWVSNAPLVIASVILLILLPFVSKSKRSALLVVAVLILPIVGLYLFCKFISMTHFFTSRYFINLLPLFFITLYLSISTLEDRYERLKRLFRFKLLFMIFFILSNLTILPFYYRAEKTDYRGLANYLNANLQDGDIVVAGGVSDILGILHYFRAYPQGPAYRIPFNKVSEDETEYKISMFTQNRNIILCHSKTYWNRYAAEGKRLWIVAGQTDANKFKQYSQFLFKGYFDGSFLNFKKFPDDNSLYLFLWDPRCADEKGIDRRIN